MTSSAPVSEPPPVFVESGKDTLRKKDKDKKKDKKKGKLTKEDIGTPTEFRFGKNVHHLMLNAETAKMSSVPKPSMMVSDNNWK